MARTLILAAAAVAVVVALFSPAFGWLLYGLAWLVVIAVAVAPGIRRRLPASASNVAATAVLRRWDDFCRVTFAGSALRSSASPLAGMAILITAIGLFHGFWLGIFLVIPIVFVLFHLPGTLGPTDAPWATVKGVASPDRSSRSSRQGVLPESGLPGARPVETSAATRRSSARMQATLRAVAAPCSEDLLRIASEHADGLVELIEADPHTSRSPRRRPGVLYELALLYAHLTARLAREILGSDRADPFASDLRKAMAERLLARLGTDETSEELQRRFEADYEFRGEVSGYGDLDLARGDSVDPGRTVSHELTRILSERTGCGLSSAFAASALRLHVQHVAAATRLVEESLAARAAGTALATPANAVLPVPARPVEWGPEAARGPGNGFPSATLSERVTGRERGRRTVRDRVG